MRSFGFLITRRWVIFAVVVALLAYLAWWLGEWQFHRLEERKDRNAIVERNLSRAPVPVEDVLAPGEPVARSEQWRHVQASGEYAVDQTIVIRYRTRDGASGVDVVVPLVTADGTALLVDRGWLPTDNRGTASPEDVPAPPSGEVRVTGWVRSDATGGSAAVSDQSTRSISSKEIGPVIGLPVFEGFVDLDEESPAAETPLARAELPELDSGPHFFYGLQWWFFGLLAIVGFVWMAYDEWRGVTGKPRKAPARSRDRTRRPKPGSTPIAGSGATLRGGSGATPEAMRASKPAKPKPPPKPAKPKRPRTDLRTRLDRRGIEADAAADRAAEAQAAHARAAQAHLAQAPVAQAHAAEVGTEDAPPGATGTEDARPAETATPDE